MQYWAYSSSVAALIVILNWFISFIYSQRQCETRFTLNHVSGQVFLNQFDIFKSKLGQTWALDGIVDSTYAYLCLTQYIFQAFIHQQIQGLRF